MAKKQTKTVADSNDETQAILADSPRTAKFDYPARVDGPRPAAGHTLRGKAIALLTGGATLDEVCQLTEEFYIARGSHPKTSVYARAVELVRLVAKSNGYGLATDPETGIISIVG